MTAGARLALHAIPPHIAQTIEIATPPKPRSWGACDGLDPEGNVFQIVQV